MAPALPPTVVGLVVTPGASPYLARTLDGLGRQERPADVLVVVDIGGPADYGSGVPIEQLVHEAGLDAVSAVRVVRAPGAATFGAAVEEGLAQYRRLVARALERRGRAAPGHPTATWHGVTGEISPVGATDRLLVGHLGPRDATAGADGTRPGAAATWLWLLHDDSAPEPGALAALLRATEHARSVAIAGCKQRAWVDSERLLEVGLRATRTARRAIDLEDDEIDQGQRDAREDVLAVGTAGMLVRGDAWEQLGGLDPALGPFGDGLEFSRRARLAGHRVVVVPAAVVLHARAGLEGLRPRRPASTPPTARGARGASAATRATLTDGTVRRPDRRRSFRHRRSAQLHNALVAASAPMTVLLVLGCVLAAPVRALGRLATKEPHLAWAEFGAVGDMLGGLRDVRASRARTALTRTISPRELHPLETTGGEIRAARRESRRHAAALRRMREAPSELEMSEKASLAAARRRWVVLLSLALGAAGLALSGHLLGAFPSGGAIAALPGTAAELWRAATSSWIPVGLGAAGPADPLHAVLAVLASPLALVGIAPSTSLVLVLVAAPLAAGIGAWFAAGAATRRGSVRAWAALVWALSPTMILGLLEGRVGVALACAALPWVALGVAWACGVRRRDLLLPGLVGARRRRRRPAAGPELPHPAEPRPLAVFADLLDEDEEAGELMARPRGSRTTEPSGTVEPADTAEHGSHAATLDAVEPFDAAPPLPASGHNRAISLMATAGGGLALAIATAGVPALLPVAALAAALLALVVPYGRRYLALMLLPPLALHLPVLVAALSVDRPWRALLADTGVLLGTPAARGWQALLGFPEDPAASPALAPGVSTGLDPLTRIAPFVPLAWAALVLLAVVALARTAAVGGRVVRGVWAGWLLVVLGLVAHAVTTRVVVGAGAAGAATGVTGWGGAGTLLVTAGLLLAVLAADGAHHARRTWLAAHGAAPRGPRGRGILWAVAVAVGLVPIVGAAALLAPAVADPPLLAGRGVEVPALSTQLADGPDRARTLAVVLSDETLTARIMRGDGALLTETSTLAEQAGPGALGETAVETAARLVGGETGSLARRLGDLAIGVVVVPPVERTAAVQREHDDLVSRLDAVPGLERVTINDAGTVWRVAGEGDDVSVARARILGADGAVLAALPSGPVDVEADVPQGSQGRTVVLAENADAGWQARLDGARLAPVVLDDGRQGFELPADAGRLEVTHAAPGQPWTDLVRIAVLALAALLAVPVRRGGWVS